MAAQPWALPSQTVSDLQPSAPGPGQRDSMDFHAWVHHCMENHKMFDNLMFCFSDAWRCVMSSNIFLMLACVFLKHITSFFVIMFEVSNYCVITAADVCCLTMYDDF